MQNCARQFFMVDLRPALDYLRREILPRSTDCLAELLSLFSNACRMKGIYRVRLEWVRGSIGWLRYQVLRRVKKLLLLMFAESCLIMHDQRRGLIYFPRKAFALFTQESRPSRSFRRNCGEVSRQNERGSFLRGCALKMTGAGIDRYVKQ